MVRCLTALLAVYLFAAASFGQTYQMPAGTATASYITCTGTFTDNGGASGNYSSSQNSTITFCPATPGDKIKLSFTVFDTEAGTSSCRDYLDIWYGTTATGTEDSRYCGPSSAGATLPPFSIVSTSADGCLTLRFVSDASINRKGWEATISCITPCINPVANLAGSPSFNLCQSNTTASFDATPSLASQGSISRYEWDWGDGTSNNTTTSNASHTYPGPGVYQVRLAVRNNNFGTDPLGCRSTNAATTYVKVMPTPDFTGTTSASVSINCNQPLALNASVTSQTKTQSPPTFSPAVVPLRDGVGSIFFSSLDFTGLFPVGAKVNSGCYPELKFELEHSWARDLLIELVAPTGQSVKVFDRLSNPSSGIRVFGSCVNNSDADPGDPVIPGCPATYTIVNSGGIPWTDPSALTTSPSPCATYSGPCLTTAPGPGGSTTQFLYLRPLTYNSQNPFTAFNGADLNGVWSLRITDNSNVDDGVLTNWSLSFPPACYGSLETVTPKLSTAVWSAIGSAPAVPAYSTTNTPVTNPGPDACPVGVTCAGNKLTNSVVVGPFVNPGNFSYDLTVTDEFGCSYKQNVNVNVICPPTCILTLTSAAATTSQTICANTPITPITYNVGGTATDVNITGLPAGISHTLNAGVLTISGTPTSPGNINYTITTVGCTSNLTETGTIKVNDKPSITPIPIPAFLCETISFNPTVPLVADNGSVVSSQGWQIESAVGSGTFNALIIPYVVTLADNGKKIRYTATNGCGQTNSNEVVLTVNANPVVSAGSALSAICQGATSDPMGGSVSGGATGGIWSGGAGTWSNANDPATATYTAGATENGSIILTLTTNGGSCGNTIATKTIVVNIGSVSANAGPGLSAICQGAISTSMGGSVGGGATGGIWSGGSGTWTNANDPAIATYTAGATESGSITLTLTTTGGSCGTTNATKAIIVNANPIAVAGSGLNPICQGATSDPMGGSVSGGATGGTWSGGAGTWTNANDPAIAIYTASATESGSITLTLTTSGGFCGTTTAIKTITVNANPLAPSASITQPNCGSPTGTITLSGLPSGNWVINPGNIAGTGNSYPISNLVPGTYSYTVSDGNGCVSPLSNSETINAASAPPATPMAMVTRQPDCVNIRGSITVSSPTDPNLVYILNGGTPQSSLLFDDLDGGSYRIEVENTLTGCRSQPSEFYTINAAPLRSAPPFVGIAEEYCMNDRSVPVRALGQSLLWYTNATGGTGSITAPTPSTLSAGTIVYYVTQRIAGFCESAREPLTVIVHPLPSVDAGGDKEIVRGQRTTLDGTASGTGISVLWTPGFGLSDAKITTPVASPEQTTVYTLTVTSREGCKSTDNMRIVVKEPLVVRIPNVISPNGDGIHDRWVIGNIEDYPDAGVQIFNRYGAQVYEVQGYDNAKGWDGKLNGVDLPVGAYYYIIRLNGKVKSIAGTISIIR